MPDFEAKCLHGGIATEGWTTIFGTSVRAAFGMTIGAVTRAERGFTTAWRAAVGTTPEVGRSASITKFGFIKIDVSEFVAQEQWSITCGEHSESPEDLFFGEFRVFFTELLEDGSEHFVLGVVECRQNAFVEPDDPLLVDDSVVGERHRFDGLSRGSFETLQESSACADA
jgi:hypothetical protein